jgi:hypothetical protein
MSVGVAHYFVDLTGLDGIAQHFFACGNPNSAGPFMSSQTAIEWRDEFLDPPYRSPDRIKVGYSDDPNVCTNLPWYHDNNVWHQ